MEYNKELIEKIMDKVGKHHHLDYCTPDIAKADVMDILKSFLEPDLSGYPCPYCGEPLVFGKMSVVYCVGCNREIGVTLSVPEMACYRDDWRK